MQKTPTASRRTTRIRIASGANLPQIDLEAVFRARPMADSVPASSAGVMMTNVMVTGGAVQTAAVVFRESATVMRETVALADGTRITFASADWVPVLETA